MRTASILAGLLLITLAAQPVAAEALGPYAGTVRENEVPFHNYSTHGDDPCLDIYIPKLYVITLTHAPTTDTLSLRVGTHDATSDQGVATVSFVANYCAEFTIAVGGVAVSGFAAYGVTVQSVFTGPGTAIEPPM